MTVYVNGDERTVSPGLTLASLLSLLGQTADGRGVAVALDGMVVPRTRWATTALRDGARVEVIVAVQGG